MKTSLDHLPASTREALSAIAELVQTSATVEWVILFGSYARGDWVDDRETGYKSDFDPLGAGLVGYVGGGALGRVARQRPK